MIDSSAILNVVTGIHATSIVSQLTVAALPDVTMIPHVLVEHRPVPERN
jgi:hypothetical protein